MKRTNYNRSNRSSRSRTAYPNAATAADRVHRFLDYMLMGATTFGIVTALLFLVTL